MIPSKPGRRRNGEPGLVQRVRARLEALPIGGTPTIVVGVSGGVDSLALTGILSEIARSGSVRIVAVHVDHRLRPASSVEQDLVEALVSSLDVSFQRERLESDLRSRHPGVGPEEAARRERYSALAAVAGEHRADAIALGHHALDQAETVLLHLLRGAGPLGISGMAELSHRPIPWWETGNRTETEPVAIWRPLILEPKSALVAYVQSLGLVPIEDPSNASSDYRRNRIRHDLLPLMEDIFPGATAALVRYARLAAAEDQHLHAMALAELPEAADSQGRLGVQHASRLDSALQRRVVRIWLESSLPGGIELSQERIEAVCDLLGVGRGGSRIEIGEGWQVLREGSCLRLSVDTDLRGQ